MRLIRYICSSQSIITVMAFGFKSKTCFTTHRILCAIIDFITSESMCHVQLWTCQFLSKSHRNRWCCVGREQFQNQHTINIVQCMITVAGPAMDLTPKKRFQMLIEWLTCVPLVFYVKSPLTCDAIWANLPNQTTNISPGSSYRDFFSVLRHK